MNFDLAPVWAKYLAMDSDGRWFWHEFKPSAGVSAWLNKGGIKFTGENGKPSDAWKESLIERE
jgi:hypothetical protein